MAEKLNMHFNINRPDFRGAEPLRPLLQTLEETGKFEPFEVESTGRKNQGIDSFLDPKVQKALDRQRWPTEISGKESRFHLVIAPALSFTNVSLTFEPELFDGDNLDEVRDLFIRLISATSPRLASCHPDKHRDRLYKKYYRKAERHPWLPGLYWLNFIDHDEVKKLGQEAIMTNPHALVTELPEGLLIQVGKNPFDSTTAEGEMLFIKATEALPAS